ncbi:MAG: RNA 2',3'-cyclic phosphodiesterase [Candidatus Acidifodinimicrobium sp.]
MKRLFIALEIPGKERDTLDRVSKEIAKSVHGSFVDKEKMHVTIRFLGDTDISEDRIVNAIESINKGFKREIDISGLDAFYHGGLPSILFFKVATELNDINTAISSQLNIEPDRDFHPHITICRLKGENNVESIKERYSKFRLSFVSNGLALFNSDFRSYKRITGP